MSPPSTSTSTSTITIPTRPLTPSSFSPFGTLLSSPLPPQTTTFPSTPPPPSLPANQNTALKYPNIAPLLSTYHTSPTGTPATPTTTLFTCFPRSLPASHTLPVLILERHPYTTQTFIPLASPTPTTGKAIIIVAPTLPAPPRPPPSPPALTPYFPQMQTRREGMPDLRGLKAFVAEAGVGVTYGVGTWHAPMVVVGGRVDFVVVQYVSGRGEEDCQEVEVRGVEVVVGGVETAKL